MLGCGWLPDFGRFAYSLYVTIFALPIVITSLVAVGLVRGESEHMWRYEERWNLDLIDAEIAGGNNKMVRELVDGKEQTNAGLL